MGKRKGYFCASVFFFLTGSAFFCGLMVGFVVGLSWDATLSMQQVFTNAVFDAKVNWLCLGRSRDSIDIGQDCWSAVWVFAGCNSSNVPDYKEWHASQTLEMLVEDVRQWASLPDERHRQGCHGTGGPPGPEPAVEYVPDDPWNDEFMGNGTDPYSFDSEAPIDWNTMNGGDTNYTETPLNLTAWVLEVVAPMYVESLKSWPYLKAFVGELSQRDLAYFIYGGTLLGVVRHGVQPVYHNDFDIFMTPWSLRALVLTGAVETTKTKLENYTDDTNVTMSCPDQDGSVVYSNRLQVQNKLVEFIVVYTTHSFFHVWAYDEATSGFNIRVADIFTCNSNDGWAKPNVNLLRPDVESVAFGLARFNITGVPIPSGQLPVTVLRKTPELFEYLNDTYGPRFDQPYAPTQLSQVGGVVNDASRDWVSIGAIYGSYDELLRNLSRTLVFQDAVRRAYREVRTNQSTHTCLDKRSLLRRELYNAGSYDTVADLLTIYRGVEIRSIPFPRASRDSFGWGFEGEGLGPDTYSQPYCWMYPT